MKKQFLFILLSFIFFEALAQKPLIDSSVYGKWQPRVYVVLSDDGKYTCTITRSPKNVSSILIKATNGNWNRQIIGADFKGFCKNDQLAIFLKGKDSLCMLTLGNSDENNIGGVKSFKVSGDKEKSWIGYQRTKPGTDLVLRNLLTGKEVIFNEISAYQFNNTGSALLLQKQEKDGKVNLKWVDLSTGTENSFWQGANPGNFIFNNNGTGLAFISNQNGKQIWFYLAGEMQAREVALTNSPDLNKGYDIGGIKKFSDSGDKLFLWADKPITKPTPNSSLASVDVYSYKDPKLQSMQLKQRPRNDYTFVIDLHDKRLVRINNDNERIVSPLVGKYVLVQQYGSGDLSNEWNWNRNALTSIYLVSTDDGTRKCLCKNKPDIVTNSYLLSPSAKYVIHYDAKHKDYFSYETASGTTRNITKSTSTNWISYNHNDEPDSLYANEGVAGWLKGDSTVLLYSQNDIIQADPEGKRPPINLTGNYGHKYHIQFKLAVASWNPFENIFNPNSPILLVASNLDTRDNSFCKVNLGKPNTLQLSTALHFNIDDRVKAKYADVYLIEMESAESPKNSYVTTDFKTFTPLTNEQPQKGYNWLTTQLITWKKPDGTISQGILYKPENFDPHKKYPVIFRYYEKEVSQIHTFFYPEYSNSADIDIPTYVSNGYLVFVPDIHYKVGYPGKSACTTVVSAANYLSRFPWVEKHKMGLAGHSFGGFETDYIITHSHLFAAASSGAGMTDLISAYGSIIGDGSSRQRQYELSRDRMGTTPWQRPDLYVENSAVFRADKIITPVLLMSNWQDEDVPGEQGFELFTALRRLQKKAWLLQYDGEGHGLYKEIDKKDYSIRTRQFFDYYLKGLPPPKWMTEGIPASQKQINTGYELDLSGKKP